jgi:hypothetical protein
MIKDRFDLEQEIMKCWNVTEDIDNFIAAREDMSEDEQLNYLIGLKQIYEVKFSNLWATFESCIRERSI